MKLSWLAILPIFLTAGVAIWAADIVNLQGERTVYTAGCNKGNWEGNTCTGRLVAGERFRFRALRVHREVFFWNVGVASDPSGKFTDCEISNGRNWVCKPEVSGPKSITLAMARGKPVPDASGHTRGSHPVSKFTWTLLAYGFYYSNSANPP